MKTIVIYIMRKKSLFVFFTFVVLSVISCQSELEKADKLRLENKFEDAAIIYQKLADDGDAYAMWCLSKAYSNGDGVEYNNTRAFELLKLSAESGCEEAICDLSLTYLLGWYDQDKNIEKGQEMLEGLVKYSNNTYVMSMYARVLFFGLGSYNEDKEKAINILEKVRDKNNAEYCELMGCVYVNGTEKIDIDVQKGIDYFIKAYNYGRKYCAYRLQLAYANGYGNVEADNDKRIEWLYKGINSNQIKCMVIMASICLSDDSAYGSYHNIQRGIDLLKNAAKHGSGDAYYQLGNLYYYGEKVRKNDRKAFEYWKKANDFNDPHGGSNLAYAYINGVGCEKNIEKGIDIYKKAVENGSGFSSNKLYQIYWNGDYGVKVDDKMAKYYLFKAAELDDDWGCFNLGLHYMQGSSIVSEDNGQAFVYVKKAADMGLVDACAAIAYFYEEGIGCNKNPAKAKEYKNKTIVEDTKE